MIRKRTIAAVLGAAILLAGCGGTPSTPTVRTTTVRATPDTPEDPTLRLLATPIGHGCSDGSDVYGYFGPQHRTVTLDSRGNGLYWYCDERTDLPGYDR